MEAAGSLHFAPGHDPNLILEARSTSNVDYERSDDNDSQIFGIELSDNPVIQIVDCSLINA